MSLEASEIYEFGDHHVDVDRRLVLSRGEPVGLPPKTFELLLLFVRNPGRAFSKRELMTTLWPDTFVEEANLSFQISTLRKALGEGGQAGSRRFRSTVIGSRRKSEPFGLALNRRAGAAPPTRTQGVRHNSPDRIDWRWIALTAIAIAVLIAGYAMVSRRSNRVGDEPSRNVNHELFPSHPMKARNLAQASRPTAARSRSAGPDPRRTTRTYTSSSLALANRSGSQRIPLETVLPRGRRTA